MRFFLSAMTMFILQKTVNLTPNLLAGEKLFFVGKSFDNDQHQFRWIIGIDLSSSLLPFTLVTRTRQSISQQNPAAVYAKSFQLLSFKGSLSNYES